MVPYRQQNLKNTRWGIDVYDGHDLLKFNTYEEHLKYCLDISKIKTFEDAIIILAAVHEAVTYSQQQSGVNMAIESDTQEVEIMANEKKPWVMGNEESMDTYLVDSSKINTIEDVRLVIDAMELAFTEGYPCYEKLEKYLSDVPLGYKMH